MKRTTRVVGCVVLGMLALACGNAQNTSRTGVAPPSNTATKGTTMLTTATDVFDYAVGNPHFHGRSTLQITGDGAALVTFERGGKTQEYKGTVSAKQLDALRASLTAHPIDSYKPPKRPLVPDEATMELTVVNAGARAQNSIPDNERWEIEPLGELVTLINEIMGSVSGGTVRY
jgi:hypothetical protein